MAQDASRYFKAGGKSHAWSESTISERHELRTNLKFHVMAQESIRLRVQRDSLQAIRLSGPLGRLRQGDIWHVSRMALISLSKSRELECTVPESCLAPKAFSFYHVPVENMQFPYTLHMFLHPGSACVVV